MGEIILKEDDITDIDKLNDYNNDYLSYYSDYVPFVSPENYNDILERNKLLREGIGNGGVKEIYYWAIKDNKIIGHASIRLNPEVDEGILKYCGHIMYGVIPSMRKKGYGSRICGLLIDKMKELGYETVYITCSEDNVSSAKVIENNGGKYIETVEPDMKNTTKRTKRYCVNIRQ